MKTSSYPLEQKAIVWACLALLASLFVWNLPANFLQRSVNAYTRSFILPLGLWQQWDMFSTPLDKGFSLRLGRISDSGQLSYEQTFLRPEVGHLPSTLQKFYYNLAFDTSGTLTTPYLQSICRQEPHLLSVRLEVADLTTPHLLDQPDATASPPVYRTLKSVICSR